MMHRETTHYRNRKDLPSDLPPGALRGECVVCGQYLTEADYDAQRVVAIIDAFGTVVGCASHLKDDSFQLGRLMAEAKLQQIRGTPPG